MTFLFSSSFARPILSMQRAARKIQNGDYEIHLKNVSNDELGSLEDAIGEMAQGLKEKEFIKDTFGKLVDPNIRDYLLKGNVELGGQLVEATILFADIRGFTSLSEKLMPEKVVQLLNLYFERVSEDIASEGGLVNKFVGDGILAIFGAPIPLENSSLAAVRAGTKIRETVRLINGDDSSQNLPDIDIGLGIHTGPVLAGNIGSKSRMEYTVIGDTVNIASRVENLCKEFGKDFLITKSVKDQILDAGFKPIFLDSVKIRGKENLSDIYWL